MTDLIAARPPANAPLPGERARYSSADGVPDTGDIPPGEFWGNSDGEISFADFIDIINPLQHIPIVSTIYRMVTGDEISMGARMAGAALYGGPLGLLAAGVAGTIEEVSGNSAEGHIASLFDGGGPDESAAPQQLASATQALPAAPAALRKTTPAPDGEARIFPARPAAFIPAAPAAPKPAAVAPAAAAEPAPTPEPGPEPASAAQSPQEARAEKQAADRQRIAETLARARNQQAALLLASLGTAESETRQRTESKEEPAPARVAPKAAAAKPSPPDAGPFPAHPYMLPPGASPEMVSRAMEQALSKYRQGQQARGGAR